MKLLGIRYCQVAPDAGAFADLLCDGLGLPQKQLGDTGAEGFKGAVFPAGDSWIELWPAENADSAMTMLQLVVDDADAFAERARQGGLEPKGPTDAHGERIYMLTAPNGMALSFQSKL